eukprot:1927074-Prymnesium_polylepis.1
MHPEDVSRILSNVFSHCESEAWALGSIAKKLLTEAPTDEQEQVLMRLQSEAKSALTCMVQ